MHSPSPANFPNLFNVPINYEAIFDNRRILEREAAINRWGTSSECLTKRMDHCWQHTLSVVPFCCGIITWGWAADMDQQRQTIRCDSWMLGRKLWLPWFTIRYVFLKQFLATMMHAFMNLASACLVHEQEGNLGPLNDPFRESKSFYLNTPLEINITKMTLLGHLLILYRHCSHQQLCNACLTCPLLP